MPHAKILNGVTLNGKQPTGEMSEYGKNCVAFVFSRLLGVGVYPTINYFISKGWITKGKDLEEKHAIKAVVEGLDLATVYDNTSWAAVKTGMKGHKDGRYFAINWEAHPLVKGKDRQGHAIAIFVKAGSVGVDGNNQEVSNKSYIGTIKDDYQLTVYGPIEA